MLREGVFQNLEILQIRELGNRENLLKILDFIPRELQGFQCLIRDQTLVFILEMKFQAKITNLKEPEEFPGFDFH